MEVPLSISNSTKTLSLIFVKPVPPTFPKSVKHITYLSMIMSETWESSLNHTPPSPYKQSILSSLILTPKYLLLYRRFLQAHSNHYHPRRLLDASLVSLTRSCPSLQSFLSTVGLQFSSLARHQHYPWSFKYIHIHIQATYSGHYDSVGLKWDSGICIIKSSIRWFWCAARIKSISVIFPSTALIVIYKALHNQAFLSFLLSLKCAVSSQSRAIKPTISWLSLLITKSHLCFLSSKKPSLAPSVPD